MSLHSLSGALAADADGWKDYGFLVGNWSGEGQGVPGQAQARFSFAPDLQGRILVRKHTAEIQPAGGRPASTHEDLMVIYHDSAGKGTRAVYFDSEDHVIHYVPTFAADKETVTFLSDELPNQPRFRLSYTKRGEGKLAIKFEFAPPGKPDAFKTYGEGTAVRDKPRAAKKEQQ
jgi:hypothetical protein